MNFSDEKKQAVWEKGTVVPFKNSDKFRKDQCGSLIKKGDHGDRKSPTGWEIDHISDPENNKISNLRPLQAITNARKQDNRLNCERMKPLPEQSTNWKKLIVGFGIGLGLIYLFIRRRR